MKCKLGIYLMCCYPDVDEFIEAVNILEGYGIDFLEVGFPFTDPVADGPVIEEAAFSVLSRYSLDDCFGMFEKVRVLYSGKLYIMTYSNIVYRLGAKEFALRINGADGVILPDLPFDERWLFESEFREKGIPLVRFVTPENSIEDINRIVHGAEGFIYFVSVRGTTGGVFDVNKDTLEKVSYVRSIAGIDVILGFGIKTRDEMLRACRVADGVVVGTAAIESLKRCRFREFIGEVI